MKIAAVLLMVVALTVTAPARHLRSVRPELPLPHSTALVVIPGVASRSLNRPHLMKQTPVPVPPVHAPVVHVVVRVPARQVRHVYVAPSGAAWTSWAATPRVKALRQCESTDNYGDNTGNGYYGAYQANRGFWVTYGGDPSYLGTHPFAAPVAMQDMVAYRGFLSRGWEPWQCAWPGFLNYYQH